MRHAIPLAIVALVLTFATATAQTADRIVTVTGEGRVDATPDAAHVSFTVVRTAPGASEAMDAVAGRTRAALDVLAEAGIPAADVQTTGVSLNPEFGDRDGDGAPPQITGYYARSTLGVMVRDLDALGPAIRAITAAGINEVSGIRLIVSEPGEAEAAARRAAVADARAKAQTLAEAAGATLGPVMSLSEGGGGQPPMPFARAEMMAADMPVSPGTQTVTVTVTAEFALTD